MATSLYLIGMIMLSTIVAVVLPDYTDMGRTARINSLQMVAQSLRNISNDAHAEYLLKARQNVSYVMIDQYQILLQDGFPAASEKGIVAALRLPKSYISIIQPSVELNNKQASVTIQYRRSRPECWVIYQEANTEFAQFTPSIEIQTNGC